jgi:hypothetical protein
MRIIMVASGLPRELPLTRGEYGGREGDFKFEFFTGEWFPAHAR